MARVCCQRSIVPIVPTAISCKRTAALVLLAQHNACRFRVKKPSHAPIVLKTRCKVES